MEGWGGDRAGMRGIYLVLEPERKLIHTLHWDAPGMSPLDEIIVVNINGEGETSNLEYIHMGIPDDGQSAPEHESQRSRYAGSA